MTKTELDKKIEDTDLWLTFMGDVLNSDSATIERARTELKSLLLEVVEAVTPETKEFVPWSPNDLSDSLKAQDRHGYNQAISEIKSKARELLG